MSSPGGEFPAQGRVLFEGKGSVGLQPPAIVGELGVDRGDAVVAGGMQDGGERSRLCEPEVRNRPPHPIGL